MITSRQDLAQGKNIDNYLASPSSLSQFNYAECTDCHTFVELPGTSVAEWKFSLMGLRPSLLKVAKGLCPVCQTMRRQFRKILE